MECFSESTATPPCATPSKQGLPAVVLNQGLIDCLKGSHTFLVHDVLTMQAVSASRWDSLGQPCIFKLS